MPHTLVVPKRTNATLLEVVQSETAAKVLGQAAVAEGVWYTEQHLGAQILDKLAEAGFMIVRVIQ